MHDRVVHNTLYIYIGGGICTKILHTFPHGRSWARIGLGLNPRETVHASSIPLGPLETPATTPSYRHAPGISDTHKSDGQKLRTRRRDQSLMRENPTLFFRLYLFGSQKIRSHGHILYWIPSLRQTHFLRRPQNFGLGLWQMLIALKLDGIFMFPKNTDMCTPECGTLSQLEPPTPPLSPPCLMSCFL